ncbi:hypothetical protein LCGC14_1043560 [marine sediment metagenome]|uniref:Uncharacterized protein n=1 Tax=marine sediment metagenome TaxID=412755 RepID=A0A0F9QX78_9ZZZZ
MNSKSLYENDIVQHIRFAPKLNMLMEVPIEKKEMMMQKMKESTKWALGIAIFLGSIILLWYAVFSLTGMLWWNSEVTPTKLLDPPKALLEELGITDRMRKERHLYFHASRLANPYSSYSGSRGCGLGRYLPASG